MNRPLSNTMDIKPSPTRQWTVLIQVIQNGHVQYSKAGGAFKRLLFTDTQGTKSPALISSAYIRYFANLLLPYKRYYISNANVVNNEPKYWVSSYPYSWILNNRTLVEELIEPIPPTLPCEFHFTNFQDLHKHAETDTYRMLEPLCWNVFPVKRRGQRQQQQEILSLLIKRSQILCPQHRSYSQ